MPTPIPSADLAPMPSTDEIFGMYSHTDWQTNEQTV
jgi:hypothetical protein